MAYFPASWFVLGVLTVDAGSVCPNGTDLSTYSGKVSVTNGGRSCQKWVDQFPHHHIYTTDNLFKVDGSVDKAHNYCRNPNRDPVPWCFTNDPFVRKDYCDGHICKDDNAVCGGLQMSNSGWIIFTTTLVDGFNQNDWDCLWKLSAAPSHIMEVTVLSVVFLDKCDYNYVQVYEPGYYYGRYCSNSSNSSIPTFTSKSSVLYVHFYSLLVGNEVHANYSQVKTPVVMDPDCGGFLTEQEGWISPPDRDGDGLYQPVEDCYWKILAVPYHYVVVDLQFMDIEDTNHCAKDFLEVHGTSQYHGRYCGTIHPYNIIKSEPEMVLIRFVSDFEVIGKGFNLTYYNVFGPAPTAGGNDISNTDDMDTTTLNTINSSENVFGTALDTSGKSTTAHRTLHVLLSAIGTKFVATFCYSE